MDEYQVGEIARGEDGAMYRFKGGDSADPANWESADAAQATPEDAALARTNARGGNALTDFLAMARHGATLGLDDEIAGMVKGPAARDEIRQRVADRRLLNPGASALSEVAGSVPMSLLPIGAGAKAVREGGGLLSSMAKGAAMGGAQGALYGAGDADTDRGVGAVTGGLLGAGAGGLLAAAAPVANAVGRRMTGRADRLMGALGENTGLSTDINAARDAADAEVRAARAQHYAPLDAMGRVDDPAISAFLRARNLSAGPKTLAQLQKISKNLRLKLDANAADDLEVLIESAFPGKGAADAAYAPAVANRKALPVGEKMSSKPGEDITRALGNLSPEAQTNFRTGAQFRWMDKLRGADDAGSLAILKKADDRGQLRPLFDDAASYDRFVDVLNREKSAEKVLKLLPWVSGGVGAGGLFGALKLRQRL